MINRGHYHRLKSPGAARVRVARREPASQMRADIPVGGPVVAQRPVIGRARSSESRPPARRQHPCAVAEMFADRACCPGGEAER